MRRNWSQREQITAVVAMVVTTLAFTYFIFFLADPITEWFLEVLGLSD
jgi:preprotein translocase subunit SecE